ncbi:MAG: hypothetical protein IJS61_07835 [Firmicutes bacterium]|nr:hypothetical protein [Bacillota bacterium]
MKKTNLKLFIVILITLSAMSFVCRANAWGMTEDGCRGEIEINGQKVILVANNTFDNLGTTAATEAECYDLEGEYLGSVESGGTANPLAISGDKIFTGGHHYVECFTVDEKGITSTDRVDEVFDKEGNATYVYAGESGSVDSETAKEIYDNMFDEYLSAKAIEFTK